MNRKNIFLITLIVLFSPKISFSQDTTKYYGVLGSFLYETIELYPDSTFKWTRNYDLCWSDYGLYETNKSILKLKFKLESSFPKTMSLRDTLVRIDTVLFVRNFLIDKSRFYCLDSKGKKVKWLKNDFFDNNWSWLTFGYHRLRYKKMKDKN